MNKRVSAQTARSARDCVPLLHEEYAKKGIHPSVIGDAPALACLLPPGIQLAASRLSSNPARSGPRKNNRVAPITNSVLWESSSSMKEPLLNRSRLRLEKVGASASNYREAAERRDYCANPMCWTSAWKRGSPRTGMFLIGLLKKN
jgi:hypothetical protein